MKEYFKLDIDNIESLIGEFPNPLKVRTKICSLNGEWDFSFDDEEYTKIIVPFCPECESSGVGKQNLTGRCFYKKRFDYKKNNMSLVIHFGAVDYYSVLYINGNKVLEHKGGYTPFECDISAFVKDGDNEIFLLVEDKNENVFSGKQTQKGYSYGCFYSRITGIWQSVWLEERPKEYIESFKFFPNYDEGNIHVDLCTSTHGNCNIDVYYKNKVVGHFDGQVSNSNIDIKLNEIHPWDILNGELYFVEIRFKDDVVYSYFGFRSTRFEGLDYKLNNKRVFQKLILDQGYYRNGIYTPNDLNEIQKDIDNTIMLGFNGIRLHQKIFDPRHLYLCDKAGLMVWGEFPSWGVDYSKDDWFNQFISEWKEVLDRDFNHPSIVIWSPFNEIWDSDSLRHLKEPIDKVYNFTKEFDKTRPCIDVSGGNHSEFTDLFDFHCYEEPESLKKHLKDLDGKKILNIPLLYSKFENIYYDGVKPTMLSEFGGIALKCKNNGIIIKTINECAITTTEDWGYGEQETDSNKFVERYLELIEIISKCKTLSGFCYTQLYDIEQEQNGFFRYDRQPKLTKEQLDKIRKSNQSF